MHTLLSMALRKLVLAGLAASLLLAACDGGGGDGGDGTPTPTSTTPPATPSLGTCPDVTDLRGEDPDSDGPFTLNVITSFAQRFDDDTLLGDYYRVVFADFQVEPGDETIETREGERAIEIEIYARDQTLPTPGTFDFEGEQNIFFQPTVLEGGVAHFVSTLGDGGTLTLTVANDQEVCGGIDVTDGTTTVRGAFRASLLSA
jgi:hypothetical protein